MHDDSVYHSRMNPSPELRDKIVSFVDRHPLGALATNSDPAKLAVSSMYIFAHSDFTFYFGTRSSTAKFENIEKNPVVAFAISDEETLETLQVRGNAELILDAQKIRDLMDKLRTTFAHERTKWMTAEDKKAHGVFGTNVSRWVPPVSQIRDGAYAFYKVTPTWARYRRYDADWKDGKDFTEYVLGA